jgi:hypothetical protein
MKAKNILTVCALCILASCANSSKDKQTLNDNDSLSVVNSSIDVNSLTIDEISKSDSLVQGQYKMLANYVLDYPGSGNEYLLRNLREWINESLGGNYDSNLDKPEKMLDYYIKKNITPEETVLEWNTDNYVEIKKDYTTDKLVTFTKTVYVYLGGAHGNTFVGGNTFRNSDGRKFGWDMFRTDFDYIELFKKALMQQYFKVKTEKELDDLLMLPTPGYLPKPVSDPYLTKEGVVFVYQQYEIAPYAAGLPKFTLPYSEVKKYMTHTVLELLK